MGTLTIHHLDADLLRTLRLRAAHHHCSAEEEARQILCAALSPSTSNETDLAVRIRARFAGLGDVRLPLIERGPRFDRRKR